MLPDVLTRVRRFRPARQRVSVPEMKTGEESLFDARFSSEIVADQPFGLRIVSRP